jgi:hypothetical protein
MKKIEYNELHIPTAGDKQVELDSSKRDETGLPPFSKEVPVSSRQSAHGDSITVENSWKESKSDRIRAREITFRKSESLSDIHMINARDGVDTVSVRHAGSTYILRKTTKEIAMAIFNAYSHVQSGLENVVGWLKTVLGNAYVISKPEHCSWSFDRRLVRHDNLNYVDPDCLDESQKKSLCDMIIQNIAALHSRRLVLGGFTLNSVLLTNDGVQFTDLRGLRAARKRSFCVEEFKTIVEYLFALGLMKREDMYLAIATYNAANEEGCEEWYAEKSGKAAKDELEIADMLESEIAD